MNESKIGTYQIVKEIGRGSFGTVYDVINTKDSRKYALKLEDPRIERSQLANEYSVYLSLSNVIGVPKIYFFGKHKQYTYMIIERLGPSLSHIHNERARFTLKSCCIVMKRLLNILESIHEHGWIYRDMKPENVLIYDNEIYLIDYGMCKKYIVNGKHIPERQNKVLTGTARYASVNTHLGFEQARRDDLEGLFYVVIYLYLGFLPWMGVPAPTRKEKYAKIGEIKNGTKAEVLCSDIPGKKYFILILEYIKSIGFEQKPDYNYIRDLIDDLMRKNKIIDDNVFDWTDRNFRSKEKKLSRSEKHSVPKENISSKKNETPWDNFKSFFK